MLPLPEKYKTYFNPSFSQNVQTNIGQQFFKILDKCFPKNHPLSKIINRNTVKLSYKCMKNIKTQISRHNHRVQQPVDQQEEISRCNCRNPPCPLDGKCVSSKSVVYRATVTVKENKNNDNNNSSSNNIQTYTGLTKNTFKKRFNGHKASFNKRKKEHSTTLSTHIWELKDRGADFDLNWSIIEKGKKFDPSTRRCLLCLKEKYHILFNQLGQALI